MRVLLIDADTDARSALAARARVMPGVEVIGEAGDGKLALALAKAMNPDVILMAINMPFMDGITAARLLRGDCPRVRVIGLARKDERPQKVQAMLDEGAMACVRTHTGLDTLLTALSHRQRKSR